MAYGKPIIASDVGSVAEMLAEGAGIIVKPRDVSSLTQALVLLLRDRELPEKMGNNARETYLRKHRAEIVGLAYLDLYQEVLKRT
jgi:glycosyltransferase involved in cell wall biosynthesis